MDTITILTQEVTLSDDAPIQAVAPIARGQRGIAMDRPYKLQLWDGNHSYWLMQWQTSFKHLESAIKRARDGRKSQAEKGHDWHYRVIDNRVKNDGWSGDYKVVFSTKNDAQT